MTPLTFVVDALATARLTRLVVHDSFPPVAKLRNRILTHPATPAAVAEALECSWCAGLWLALATVGLRRWVPRLWAPLALGLAYSQTAGLLDSQDS